MTVELLSAAEYSIEELTDLYNQTRVDYLVPMPMNAERLQNYVDDFDVDLERSCVARSSDGQVHGLGMFGVRNNLTWITRLGVLPVTRRVGACEAMMNYMLENADALELGETHLEVISNNEPAYNLFLKKGFQVADKYLVLRRAPQPITEPLSGRVKWLEKDEAVQTLQSYPNHLSWITAIASMRNAPNTMGLRIRMPDGGAGWLVFRLHKFSLSHLIMHTEQGNAVEVGTQLLRHLDKQYPNLDTYAENIHESDPHLPAFKALSFFENFSRVEMRRPAMNPFQNKYFPELHKKSNQSAI
ncbi:MAG: GNAT family N-acetyltransferase [Anaerolineae bacterium]|nr:GNAT family N-acetyltransferase [Anaerolineae bacterium]